MRNSYWKRPLPMIMMGCLLVVIGWASLAQSGMMGKRNIIQERRQLMRNTGGNFKDARLKAKDGQFDRIAINAHTLEINAHHIPFLYPEGSMGTEEIKTRAKLEIWQDWEGFTAASGQLRDAARKLHNLTKNTEEKPVTESQVAEALKAVGGACKNCHDKFRVPKKKK